MKAQLILPILSQSVRATEETPITQLVIDSRYTNRDLLDAITQMTTDDLIEATICDESLMLFAITRVTSKGEALLTGRSKISAESNKGNDDEKWYKKPMGILIIFALTTIIGLAIKEFWGHWFPAGNP